MKMFKIDLRPAIDLLKATISEYEQAIIKEMQQNAGSLVASTNFFTILVDSVKDKFPHLSEAEQQVKVMELLKEQFVTSSMGSQTFAQCSNTQPLAGESQDPYEDDKDDMSISSTELNTESQPLMIDFFDAMIATTKEAVHDKGKHKAKDA